jgi:tetratricopeptide (TPR) repeat protein
LPEPLDLLPATGELDGSARAIEEVVGRWVGRREDVRQPGPRIWHPRPMPSPEDRKLSSLLRAAVEHHQAGRLPPAEAGYRHVLASHPADADAHYNLGLLLARTQRPVQAEAHYRRALQAQPGNARAWNNLGNLLRDTGRPAEAVPAFERALERDPGHRHARVNLALALLALGRYAEAWPLYESRIDAYAGLLPALACPRWSGDSPAGRRLLLVCEQGFGDAVQFIRYAPLLRERGAAAVSVLCRTELAPLLATCAGIDRVLPADDGSHDVHVPLLSLPLHFGTTLQNLPADQPYLRPLPDRRAAWEARLPTASRRIGLAWRGNAGHPNDASRSLCLRELLPLWSVPDVIFVSLQKGAGETEALAAPADQPLAAAGAGIQDFGDLAAVMDLLDAVVSVDTAVAHVAGALGKPCWVLLPAAGCDWRWQGGSDGSTAPWYPRAMRLVRQGPEGWAGAVNSLPWQLHDHLQRLRPTGSAVPLRDIAHSQHS